MTQIMPCTCHHPFQEAIYGERMRAHNRWKKGWRCTVCAREKITNGQV